MSENQFPYLHGFSSEEQERLYAQAEFTEHIVYRDIDFTRAHKILEVGCGVGAQSEILLRRFPKISLTGIDLSEKQLKTATERLNSQPVLQGRFELHAMDATQLSFSKGCFDGAFLCWILEHVKEPVKVLSEVRRVLRQGSTIYITEVMNSNFFLDPYSPNTWKYWMAYNDFQLEHGGDPFVGAKLGNLLTDAGFSDIQLEVKRWHLDKRDAEGRREVISFWADLLLSAADQLLKEGCVTEEIVEGMKQELDAVQDNPEAVFFDAFIQARAIS